MADDDYELDEDEVTIEQLQKVKLFAEVNLLRLKAEELSASNIQVSVTDHYQRVVNFIDSVDYHSVKNAIKELAQLSRESTDPIEIIFHSPGGDIFAGFGLFDYIKLIRNQGIEVNTVVLGGAFSMAAVLLQAGTTRIMSPNSWLMIHEAGTRVGGKTSAIKAESELMERIELQTMELLAERSILSVAQIRAKADRNDWYMDATEAFDLGFIDAIRPEPTMAGPKPRRRAVRKVAA